MKSFGLLLVLLPLAPIAWAEAFGDRLAAAAFERTKHEVRYDGVYVGIDYPLGDVPGDTGVCTDVVIRAYRVLGVDLQELVHKDISADFAAYPSRRIWGLVRPDPNIDHRRVPILRTFFARHGAALPVTQQADRYLPGDVVSWELAGGAPHIGIVSGYKGVADEPLVVHNIGRGPKLERALFRYKISGHYRFQATGPN